MAVPLARRVVAVVLSLVVGLCLGALGIVMQASRTLLAGHQVPWGMVITLGVLVIVVRSACWYARSRSAGAFVAVGWAAATFVLAFTGPGGDILLPSITRSWIYLIGGLVVVFGAAILPLPQQDTATMVSSDAVGASHDAGLRKAEGQVAATVPVDARGSPAPTVTTEVDADGR